MKGDEERGSRYTLSQNSFAEKLRKKVYVKNICKYVLFLDCSVKPVCSAASAVQGTTASCCLAGNRVSVLDVRLSLVTEVSRFQFSLYRCALIKLTQPASEHRHAHDKSKCFVSRKNKRTLCSTLR